MGAIALVGTKGSPGTTTLALALGAVWPRPVVVAECDPSGGDIGTRFGLPSDPGMASFVLAVRQDRARPGSTSDRMVEHTQELPGGLRVIVGSPAGDSALALDEELARTGGPFGSLGDPVSDVILDCGRFMAGASGQLALLRTVATVVLVAKPEAASLVFAHWMAAKISDQRPDRASGLVLAVTGDRPMPPAAMADALSIDLLGAVPVDPVGAALVGGKPGRRRALARSALISTATRFARRLDSNRMSPAPWNESGAETQVIALEEQRDAG